MLIALPNAYGDAAQNMAIHAALLDDLPRDTALFRHYGWTEPTITFGYTQKWRAVNQLFPDGLQFCRRITGGGIVDHRNDWTYSIIFSRSLPVGEVPPTRIYLELHQSILGILQQVEISCRLAPCPRKCKTTPPQTEPSASQCFVEASANDVLRPDGSKIAGAALKRTRKAFLVQGSINREKLPASFNYARFQNRFLTAISQNWGIPITEPDDLRTFFQNEHIARERNRFMDPDWLHKR